MILSIFNLVSFPALILLSKVLKQKNIISDEKMFYLIAGFNLGIGLIGIAKYLQ